MVSGLALDLERTWQCLQVECAGTYCCHIVINGAYIPFHSLPGLFHNTLCIALRRRYAYR